MTTSLGTPNADLRRGGRRGTHWNFASAFSRWDPPLRFDMPPDATDPDAGPGPSRGAEWAVCATLVHVGVFEQFGHGRKPSSEKKRDLWHFVRDRSCTPLCVAI